MAEVHIFLSTLSIILRGTITHPIVFRVGPTTYDHSVDCYDRSPRPFRVYGRQLFHTVPGQYKDGRIVRCIPGAAAYSGSELWHPVFPGGHPSKY